MSVLYLSYSGALDPLGASQVLPYVLGLAEGGFSIELVSFEKPDRLAAEGDVDEVRQRLGDGGVGWTPLPYHKRFSLAATAYDVLMGVRAARRLHSARPVQLVHARSYVAGMMARRFARRAGVPWIFDMRGFWVDERVSAGVWGERSLTARLARAAERRLLTDASAIVQLTEAGATAVSGLAPGGRHAPVTVVPTCVDLTCFSPPDDPVAARARLDIPLADGPVMVYSGSLSTWYLPDLTLRVGEAFCRRTGGSFVVLTQEVEFVEERARALGTAPIVRAVSPGEVPAWLAAADVGLSFVRPDPAKQASAPTKVAEYLASGLAVVATSGVGDLEAHFAGSPVAWTVSPEVDPEFVVDRALEALAEPDRAGQARALAELHYDLGSGVAKLTELYRSLGVAPTGAESCA